MCSKTHWPKPRRRNGYRFFFSGYRSPAPSWALSGVSFGPTSLDPLFRVSSGGRPRPQRLQRPRARLGIVWVSFWVSFGYRSELRTLLAGCPGERRQAQAMDGESGKLKLKFAPAPKGGLEKSWAVATLATASPEKHCRKFLRKLVRLLLTSICCEYRPRALTKLRGVQGRRP